MSSSLFNSFRSKIAVLITAATCASAAQAGDVVRFQIPAQPAAKGLNLYAEQAGKQILFRYSVVHGKDTSEVVGSFSKDAALDTLLAETGLEAVYLENDTVTIRPAGTSADDAGGDGDPGKRTTPGLMLMASTSTNRNDSETGIAAAAKAAADADAAGGSAGDGKLEEIIVTGSQLIDDPGKLTRQITIFNRAEIERSGVTRLDEFLRRLPQNVNAPGNVGSGIDPAGLEFGLGQNVFAGSTVNLRGLGAQYTLILINGRRPARGGQFGEITDISNIPIDRIERIEVLFDGAAAVYGADAVGGVVNIITRQDYDGTNVSLTYSDTEDGGGARTNLLLGHTFNWGSGSLTASASYQTQEAIGGGQRPDIQLTQSTLEALGPIFLPPSANGNIRSALLRNFDISAPEYRALFWVNGDERLSGGVEVPALQFTPSGLVETTAFVDRQTGQLPPGYLWIDEANDRPQNPETLGFTPVFQADLPQYSGQILGLAELGTSNGLGDSVYVPFGGQALSPEDDTYNIGLSFVQNFSEDILLTVNADYIATSKVNVNRTSYRLERIAADAPANPFGQDFNYAFQDVFPQRYQDIESTNYNVSGAIDWDFAPDWSLGFGFGYSEQEQDAETINSLRTNGANPDNLEARLNGYYETPAPDGSGFVREFIGTDFNDPLLGYDSFEEMIAALVIPFQRTYNHSTQYEADLRLLGKLFALPAGDVRTSLSFRYREDETEIFENDQTIARTGNPIRPRPGSPSGLDYDERFGENVRTLAAEVSVPVFGSDFDLPLVDSFLLSFSGSVEEYSNTEEDGFNWAAGFNWGVTEEFIVRLNRTYNLRVPESVRTAQEPRWRFSGVVGLYNDPNDQVPAATYGPVWTISGGANHLRPERNYNTALSFIYRPAFVEGLDIQVNLTQSDTVDQLGNPFFLGRWTFDTVLPDNVRSNPLLDFGDPENNAFHALAVDTVGGEIVRMAPGDLISDTRQYNVGDTFNRGADFQIGYNLATRFGDWLLTWRHQYLDTNEVTRSNICDQVEQGCNLSGGDLSGTELNGLDEPIDTVGSVSDGNFALGTFALPRNRGSIELFWSHRGLGANLSTQYTATTSVFKTRDIFENVIIGYFEFNGQRIPITERQFAGTNVYREDSRPEQTVHLSLRYDFGRGSLFDAPGWLDNAVVSLTVDNLYTISERKQSTTIVQNEAETPIDEIQRVNLFTVLPRGRSYALRFSTTF